MPQTESIDEFNDLPAAQQVIRQHSFSRERGFLPFRIGEVEQSLSRRFEQQAERYPERIAIKTPHQQLTYEQLNGWADSIAHTVSETMGREQAAIGLLLESDPSAIAAMLGALKSGQPFVTLDPLFPQDRIAYMLEDSRAKLIVSDSRHMALARELAKGGIPILNTDEIDAKAPAATPHREIRPDQLAYIIYTSGSTGQPKGIVFNHRSVLFGIRNYTNAFHISTHDRLTMLHSPSFSSGIVDIFCGLLNGAAVYPWNVKRDGLTGLAEWLAAGRLTIFDWVPTPFRYFVQTISSDTGFPDMRLLILASEPVSAGDVDLYKTHFSPNCIFVNRLGATETYNFRLFFADHDSRIEGSFVPAGYAVPGKRVLLRDDEGRDVEQGQVGEIMIQSRYLSNGYWCRPDLTKAAFLPDPAGGDERIYRTGDLGVIHEDGLLEYRGRKDLQLKIRGYRIEMGEIEAALKGLAGVREAAVVVTETEMGEPHLIGYYVPARNPAPESRQLRHALSGRLPDYMVPSVLVQRESLPVTPSGKLDRRQLAVEAAARRKELGMVAPPADEIEYRLLQVWESVLGIHSIALTDNFFELGGHSLTAMRLLAEIALVFNAKLPQTALLQYPTIQTLARVLREQRAWDKQQGTAVLPVQPHGGKTPIFAMPGIMGNVFSDLGGLARNLGPDQPFYGLQDGLELPVGVQAKAAAFLREIRALQPHGPYLLAGVCSGALTISAIARTLQQDGEEVALLAFIEPAFPWKPGLRSILDFFDNVYFRLTRRLGTHKENVSQLGPANTARYVRLKLKLIGNMWGSRRYTAGSYRGTIHIFSTRPSLQRKPRSFQTSWEQFATGGIRTHEIPGTHNSITGDFDTPIEEQSMQVIAKSLAEVIDGMSTTGLAPALSSRNTQG